MKPLLLSVATLLLSLLPSPATATASDSSFVKKGFSFGILPAISFDSDLGFQYGVLSNLYWYGDGSRYPAYDHSLYVEWSRHVAGTMLCRLYYDSPMRSNNSPQPYASQPTSHSSATCSWISSASTATNPYSTPTSSTTITHSTAPQPSTHTTDA